MGENKSPLPINPPCPYNGIYKYYMILRAFEKMYVRRECGTPVCTPAHLLRVRLIHESGTVVGENPDHVCWDTGYFVQTGCPQGV